MNHQISLCGYLIVSTIWIASGEEIIGGVFLLMAIIIYIVDKYEKSK